MTTAEPLILVGNRRRRSPNHVRRDPAPLPSEVQTLGDLPLPIASLTGAFSQAAQPQSSSCNSRHIHDDFSSLGQDVDYGVPRGRSATPD